MMIGTLIALVVAVLGIAIMARRRRRAASPATARAAAAAPSRGAQKKKTKAGARHRHRAAGTGRRRRRHLPARRDSCPFRYARPKRDASRRARFVVIWNNDRIENAIQEARRTKNAA